MFKKSIGTLAIAAALFGTTCMPAFAATPEIFYHTDFKKSIHFYLIFGIVGTAVYQILVCYFTAHDRFSRLHSLIRSILKFAKQTTKKAANLFQTYCSCAAAGRRLFSCK